MAELWEAEVVSALDLNQNSLKQQNHVLLKSKRNGETERGGWE